MPVANRPDPLPLLSTPSPAAPRATGGAPTSGPGSFLNALSQVQGTPTPERDIGRRQEPVARRADVAAPAQPAAPADRAQASEAPTTSTAANRGPGTRAKPAPGQQPATPTAGRSEPLAPEPSTDPAAETDAALSGKGADSKEGDTEPVPGALAPVGDGPVQQALDTQAHERRTAGSVGFFEGRARGSDPSSASIKHVQSGEPSGAQPFPAGHPRGESLTAGELTSGLGAPFSGAVATHRSGLDAASADIRSTLEQASTAASLGSESPLARSAEREALHHIAAHLPAPVTRASPLLDVDMANASADDELPAESASLSLVGNTRRAAAALGLGAESAAPTGAAPAVAAQAPPELSARAAAAWTADPRPGTTAREPGLPRVEVVATGHQGWASPSAPLVASLSSTTPATAALSTPLDHPDFAQALGAQVAVWAADGQHEAELHLNPGHMGPVQVWIGVEGAQAQVRFSADLAPTRDALQAALPQLEQALAREGLQLGGADVQARDSRAGAGSPSGGDTDGTRRGRGGSLGEGRGNLGEPEALTRTPRPPGARVGLLDLYA